MGKAHCSFGDIFSHESPTMKSEFPPPGHFHHRFTSQTVFGRATSTGKLRIVRSLCFNFRPVNVLFYQHILNVILIFENLFKISIILLSEIMNIDIVRYFGRKKLNLDYTVVSPLGRHFWGAKIGETTV
jgi:hypothetical protein